MKTTTKIVYPAFAVLVLGCFALAPTARAVSPFPDGGYPGGNTAEGDFALQNLTTGYQNTAIGASALAFTTTGSNNTATGAFALNSNTADNNTATGSQALADNTTGTDNTANGFLALGFNTTGHDNTAMGFEALQSNIGATVGGGGNPNDGSFNTAVGSQALTSNIRGSRNTSTGYQALYSNDYADGPGNDGNDNTATGFQALFSNRRFLFFGGVDVAGHDNTATGSKALYNNWFGTENTAAGSQALYRTVFGNDNTATGTRALYSNTSPTSPGGDASFNTADGVDALHSNSSGGENTAIGEAALFNSGGNNNIGLGVNAGSNLTTGDNNIDIGNMGVAVEANTIRIGTAGTQKATFIAGIIGIPIAGATVHISGTGQLGIGPPSSVRFKNDIKPMDKASEAILALKPVTFHYKKELDPERIPQFGLVAEEVEKVNPDLVARDDQGKVYTVRYEAVNAMLLNEFLKEHRTVQEQQKQIEKLTAELKKQAAQIRKVNDKVELSRLAPQMAGNNQ